MSADNTTIKNICIHEAGHTVVALALGCAVKRATIRLMGGACVGLTYPSFRASITRRELIAVYLGGTLATDSYRHLSLPEPMLFNFAVVPNPAKDQRVNRDINRFDYSKTSKQSGSQFDGDLGIIDALLVGFTPQDKQLMFANAERLCRAALNANERLLRRIAIYLLNNGTLAGEPLAAFGAEIVRVCPKAYKPLPRVDACTV